MREHQIATPQMDVDREAELLAATAQTLRQRAESVGQVLRRHGLEQGDKLESSFFPIIYPRFNDNEAKERDSGKVGRSPRDIASKLGGLAGKASGDKFASFFQVLGSQAKQ